MKTVICFAFAVLMLIFSTSVPSYAGRHGHGHGSFYFRGGVWLGPGWDPWWGYPYRPYYPYYPYYSPAPAVQQQTPVYVQPPSQAEEQQYWYYCTNPQGYYPYIKQCPGGWMKVVPSPTPPEEGK